MQGMVLKSAAGACAANVAAAVEFVRSSITVAGSNPRGQPSVFPRLT